MTTTELSPDFASTAWLAAGLVLAYVTGSVPFGYVIVRLLKGVDVRKFGSGNPGATNVFRVAGPVAGVAAGVADCLKGWAAVAVFCAWFPEAPAWARVASGLAAVVGHNWPVWLGFRGGKGILTTAGVFAYLAWLPLLVAVAAFFAAFAPTRYVSVGSLAATAALAISVFAIDGPWREPFVETLAAATCLLAVIRHRANIMRLLSGKEHRFGSGRKRP